LIAGMKFVFYLLDTFIASAKEKHKHLIQMINLLLWFDSIREIQLLFNWF